MKKKKDYKKLFNAALATTMATGAVVAVAPVQVDAAAKGFPDVQPNVHYYEPVQILVERGIISGYPDGMYKPGNRVTRGQAAKILANILELDTVNVKDPGFKDISKSHQYYGAIAALVEAGIIQGYEEDHTYRPNNRLTRAHMSKILSIGFGFKEEVYKGDKFTDVNAEAWYANYVETLLTNSITTGRTETTFEPGSHVTRGQMASFVVRSEKVKAINDKIAELEDLLQSDFSEESWEALQKAIEAAKKIAADTEAKQAEVDAILKALDDALNGLIDTDGVTKRLVADAIKRAEGLNKEHYTSDTWTTLEVALGAAKNVNDNENATPEQIKGAYDTLVVALMGLKVVEGADVIVKELLGALIDMAENDYKESQYTAKSWSAFAKAVKEAKTVHADKLASQEEIDEAYEGLKVAINSLQLTSSDKTISAVEKAEETLSQKDYDEAKRLVDAMPAGSEKTALEKRLEAVKVIIDSEGPRAAGKSATTKLFTEPIVTKTEEEQKTSGGLVGLNLGVVDLGLLSGNQISDLSKNENNLYNFTVEKGNERDVEVSVNIHTILGGKNYTLNVYKKTGENELTRIDQIEASSGGALGIGKLNVHDLGTFEEGEYTIFLALEEGLTVVEVVPFKLLEGENRDYSQVSTTESVITGNLLDGQIVGANNNAVISYIKQSSGAVTQLTETVKTIQGQYGTLEISNNGQYKYVPANNKDNAGKIDEFEFEIMNTYNKKSSTGLLRITLEEDKSTR